MNTDRFFYAAALLAFPAVVALAAVESVQISAAQQARLQAPAVVQLERVVITAKRADAVVAAASGVASGTAVVQ
jgi:hypothetical protein